jgi:tripartite-type tricarboxylate transporter receptor subunit TctC
MNRCGFLFMATVLVVSIVLSSAEVIAAPYYEGKTMRIIVGFTPGGGYDRMARLLGKYLPKYIPGNPTIIIENMGGASSIIAANHIYNAAKPDGLTIGTLNRAIPFAQLIKLEGVKFDVTKYAWVGSAAVEGSVFTIRAELPYKTVDDLRKAKEPLAMGSSGAGTSDYQFALINKEFLGLNLKMITYPSSAECMLAVERKEVDGRAGSFSSLKPFIDRGVVRPILRGRVTEKGMENLPLNEDLTTDPMGKTIMAMFSSGDLIGRPYVAPPGTPEDVMKILRESFAKAAKDPELMDESKKVMMEVDYTPADECLKIVTYVLSQPEEIVKEFAKFVKF